MRGPLILLAILAAVALTWWLTSFVTVVAVVAAVVLLVTTVLKVRRWWLVRAFRRKWGPPGKDLLLVYSNSPHWQQYVESRWLPLLGPRAVVLNWSERSRWDTEHPLEGTLAREIGGDAEFNPMVIWFSERWGVLDFRFWQAFRDFKHGNDRELRRLEHEMSTALGVTFPES